MEQYNILELIPQRPPFVMVDSILMCNEQKTISAFSVKKDNVLVSKGKFSEAGMIENIAQTAAARMGYLSRMNGQEPLVGYIGAVKNLAVFSIPEVEAKLKTEVEVVSEIMGFTVIRGSVFMESDKMAECEMRIFLVQ
jgi:3-hydroxymyristoyl/3-hydroxydecanoyl-(acyl carrier protein) dehydratase